MNVGSGQSESPSKPFPYRYERLKPGPGQSRRLVAASQRERVQQAMVELAARDSFDQVTVRKLAKQARVSTGAFYSQFDGTDHCLLGAYRAVMSELTRRILGSRLPRLDLAGQVDRTLRVFLGWLLEYPVGARFALIEVYGGGAAALAEIMAAEGRLEAALRACLNRRGRQVPASVTSCLAAAALHSVRTELEVPGTVTMHGVDVLVEWACGFTEGAGHAQLLPPTSMPDIERPVWRGEDSGSGGDETSLILSALLKLALRDRFVNLTPIRVSVASGVPVARFKRHFASLAEGYLEVVRQTCRAFFSELTSAPAGMPAGPDVLVPLAIQSVWRRAVGDPTAANLIFRRVVEPGLSGLTCREALVSDLAAAWHTATPGEDRRQRIEDGARAAALWSSLARAGLRQR